ncbi:MAG: histone deacetylase family protein [Halobacteriaceae archaeon]
MRFGYSATCLEHDPGSRHPESPDRLRAIRQALAKRHGVEYVDAPPADRETVETVHRPSYVDEFEAFCRAGGGNWDPDTVAVEATWEAALAGCGLAVWAAEAALDGDEGRQTPFSLGRPPGHHALTDDAMGFCFLNNVAVAAEAALAAAASQVAILDWDVHHGNGTQSIFADRADVFYCSIHEEGRYPDTGDPTEVGTGPGRGATLNLALPARSGDADYRHAVDELIAPAMATIDPDVLLVSAGFDAHREDPLSRMRLSSEGYGMLTDRVREIADETDAALAFVLEGGYNLDVLADAVATVHETFDGRVPEIDGADPSDRVDDDVASLRDSHPLFGVEG